MNFPSPTCSLHLRCSCIFFFCRSVATHLRVSTTTSHFLNATSTMGTAGRTALLYSLRLDIEQAANQSQSIFLVGALFAGCSALAGCSARGQSLLVGTPTVVADKPPVRKRPRAQARAPSVQKLLPMPTTQTRSETRRSVPAQTASTPARIKNSPQEVRRRFVR